MAAPQLFTDVRLKLIDARALSIYAVEDESRRITSGGRGVTIRDFHPVSDQNNLGQAVAIRLLTPKGELAPLAHPEYGSRLPDLIGAPNTETTRNLARLYVLEALAQERRIAEIKSVDVRPHAGDRHRIDVEIRVIPIGLNTVLTLGPFSLDLA